MLAIELRPAAKRMSSVLARWKSCASSLPVVTILLSAAAIAVQLHPDLGDRMNFDRTAIAAGQYWRLFTGHFTHCSGDHLAWDVLMFVLLGGMIERRSRRLLVATLVASASAISFAVWFGHSGLEHYRGLSGIDSAFFTLALLIMLDDALRARQAITVWALVAMAAGFVAKIGWELATGSTLFVDSSRAGFVPLPLVHAVGGLTGAVAWLAGRRRSLFG